MHESGQNVSHMPQRVHLAASTIGRIVLQEPVLLRAPGFITKSMESTWANQVFKRWRIKQFFTQVVWRMNFVAQPLLETIDVRLPQGANAIIGGSHFIKTARDLFEAIAESAPAAKFGLAFCEASGKRLIRTEGNDESLVEAAAETAAKIGAGHFFVVFLRNAFPVSVLNRIKSVSEVTCVYAATANPLQVIVAVTPQGRSVLGVVDGLPPLGTESAEDRIERRELVKKLGYKS